MKIKIESDDDMSEKEETKEYKPCVWIPIEAGHAAMDVELGKEVTIKLTGNIKSRKESLDKDDMSCYCSGIDFEVSSVEVAEEKAPKMKKKNPRQETYDAMDKELGDENEEK
jgi:hypothetical protein